MSEATVPGATATSGTVERLSAELEALLTRELSRAWHDVNASFFKRAMKPPIVRLGDAAGYLGRWHRDTRTLELARAFVSAAPWGEVLEVLKHEAAHQYAHEILGATDETAHGPAFAGVCARLGIDGRATGRPLPQGDDPELDRIRRRIADLLALATSQNQHEAENAALLAQRLMLKHNIALSERPERRRYAYRQLGEPKGRVPENEHILAAILADHYFVEAIWVSAYRAADGRRGHVIELCGTPENLELAEYVHAFLSATGERLWRAHKQGLGTRSNQGRRGFLAGMMEGFRERLVREKTKHREEGLVWVGDAELGGYFRQRHPHMRSVRLRGHGPSEARQSGREAGREIVLQRGVSSGPTAKTPRALPPKR